MGWESTTECFFHFEYVTMPLLGLTVNQLGHFTKRTDQVNFFLNDPMSHCKVFLLLWAVPVLHPQWWVGSLSGVGQRLKVTEASHRLQCFISEVQGDPPDPGCCCCHGLTLVWMLYFSCFKSHVSCFVLLLLFLI